jgi:SAM-dependent methyltransferase
MFQTDHTSQKLYWEEAGRHGYYGGTYYAFESVGSHITTRYWDTAMELADGLGMRAEHRVLDLGCGDGSFANQVLSRRYCTVHGVDFSEAGISKARQDSRPEQTTFNSMDLVVEDVRQLGTFDGIFMVGILHHVKARTPEIMRAVRNMADRVVVLEPNGAHPVRKTLELTPSYRSAGEDSFRHGQLARIFTGAGFRIAEHRRLSLFPNQMPAWGFRLLRPLEEWVERTPPVRGMCTVNAYALK